LITRSPWGEGALQRAGYPAFFEGDEAGADGADDAGLVVDDFESDDFDSEGFESDDDDFDSEEDEEEDEPELSDDLFVARESLR
jgi:hypothetical protein